MSTLNLILDPNYKLGLTLGIGPADTALAALKKYSHFQIQLLYTQAAFSLWYSIVAFVWQAATR